MRFLFLLSFVTLILASCSKERFGEKLEGIYKGTFVRTGDPLANPIKSSVTLHFSENNFSGNSTIQYYPAICEGTYTAGRSTLTAKNACFFTANFDWSLIFDGEYQYEQEGASLKIWRDFPNGGKDLYELIKEGK